MIGSNRIAQGMPDIRIAFAQGRPHLGRTFVPGDAHHSHAVQPSVIVHTLQFLAASVAALSREM